MANQNGESTPKLEVAPTTCAILATQRKKIEDLGIGIVCGEEKIGKLTTLGEEILLPVVCFEHPLISEFISGFADKDQETSQCLVDGKTTLFLALKDGAVTVQDLYPDQERPIEWLDTCVEHTLSDIKEFAKCAGGLTVHFHAPPGSKFHEPFRDGDGVIHLFAITTPMHSSGQSYPEKLFGISAETSAGFYAHLNPIPGRGTVLTDGKVDIVQVIGNNVYLLYDPVLLNTLVPENGATIFRRSLALIFSYLLTKKDAGVAEDNAPTEENVRSQIDAFAEEGLSAIRREVAREEDHVRRAEERLRVAKQSLADVRRTFSALMNEDFWAGTLRTNLISDRERILAHPKVEHVRVIPKIGIEVDTKDIVITHEGKHRHIGRFTIRFVFGTDFRIWPIITHHPKSVPHPHISAWNGPCLGNVKETIDDAVIEYRYGDALEYLLDWLENGYSPELIVWNKVEEWPTINETLKESA